MDPLTAVSLAGTIVQFVDFSSKIVSKGYHLYTSGEGSLPENERLNYVTSDLKALSMRLKHHDRLGCSTKDEQALEDMASRCSAISDELLAKLEKLRVSKNAKHRRWKSFRQALKSVWSKEDLDRLAATLREYRDQLEFHILLSLRSVSRFAFFERRQCLILTHW